MSHLVKKTISAGRGILSRLAHIVRKKLVIIRL